MSNKVNNSKEENNNQKPHWSECPQCRKIRAIVIWAIIVIVVYFNFYT